MLNQAPKRRKASAKVEQNIITTKHTTIFFLRKNENNSGDGKIWHVEVAEYKENNLKPGLKKTVFAAPLPFFLL